MLPPCEAIPKDVFEGRGGEYFWQQRVELSSWRYDSVTPEAFAFRQSLAKINPP